MKNLFVNQYSEVRSGWKIAIVFILYYLFSVLATVFVGIMNIAGLLGVSAVPYVVQIATVLAVMLTLKLVDRKKLYYVGVRDSENGINDFGYGFLLGAVMLTAIFAVLLSLDKITLENGLANPEFSGFLISGLVLYILVGFSEELLFRGYTVTALLQTGNVKMAVLISSVLFAIAHAANPNVTVVGLTNIFVVGLLLAFMFLKTGNLWMPIGFHISWNYFQGSIFGFPVSGTEPHGIYTVSEVEGVVLSGGNFGPEGGILATILLLIGFVLVWKYPTEERQRKNVNQT